MVRGPPARGQGGPRPVRASKRAFELGGQREHEARGIGPAPRLRPGLGLGAGLALSGGRALGDIGEGAAPEQLLQRADGVALQALEELCVFGQHPLEGGGRRLGVSRGRVGRRLGLGLQTPEGELEWRLAERPRGGRAGGRRARRGQQSAEQPLGEGGGLGLSAGGGGGGDARDVGHAARGEGPQRTVALHLGPARVDRFRRLGLLGRLGLPRLAHHVLALGRTLGVLERSEACAGRVQQHDGGLDGLALALGDRAEGGERDDDLLLLLNLLLLLLLLHLLLLLLLPLIPRLILRLLRRPLLLALGGRRRLQPQQRGRRTFDVALGRLQGGGYALSREAHANEAGRRRRRGARVDLHCLAPGLGRLGGGGGGGGLRGGLGLPHAVGLCGRRVEQNASIRLVRSHRLTSTLAVANDHLADGRLDAGGPLRLFLLLRLLLRQPPLAVGERAVVLERVRVVVRVGGVVDAVVVLMPRRAGRGGAAGARRAKLLGARLGRSLGRHRLGPELGVIHLERRRTAGRRHLALGLAGRIVRRVSPLLRSEGGLAEGAARLALVEGDGLALRQDLVDVRLAEGARGGLRLLIVAQHLVRAVPQHRLQVFAARPLVLALTRPAKKRVVE